MKMIKIGAVIIIGFIGLFLLCSYGTFIYKQYFLSTLLQADDQQVIIQKMAKPEYDELDQTVLEHDMQYHANQYDLSAENIMQNFSNPDLFNLIMIKTEEKNLAKLPIVDDENDMNFYSFVTMPIPDGYMMDIETQRSFDILIGNDFNRFINLILQSNNDIVSRQACRSCSLYAFFKKIKHHKYLTADEIKTLQHIIENLYRFVENIKNISNVFVITPEQYEALQDLHRSEDFKNNIKLQARKAAAAAALKKLQSMSNR